MGKQEIKIVTLRPDELDSKAIVTVKELYSTKEATTAILSSVRDVILMEKQIEELKKERDELQNKLDNLWHQIEVFIARNQHNKDQIEFWERESKE